MSINETRINKKNGLGETHIEKTRHLSFSRGPEFFMSCSGTQLTSALIQNLPYSSSVSLSLLSQIQIAPP